VESLADFINQEVANRVKEGGSGKVLMKLDIEGKKKLKEV